MPLSPIVTVPLVDNGRVAAEIVKPVPDNVAELMITGPVPVGLSVTGKAAGVFTVTLPKPGSLD